MFERKMIKSVKDGKDWGCVLRRFSTRLESR